MTQNSTPHNVIYPANISRLRKAWIYSTGNALESSPVVAGGIISIGSKDHNLYALASVTGEKLWSYTTGGAIVSSPAVAESGVYLGSNDHNLYAFNQTHLSKEA